MVNILDFTNRLKKILNYHQLTASLFADKIGVQRSSVSHVLSGRNKPSLDFILKINKSIENISLDWLFNDISHLTEPPTPIAKIKTSNNDEIESDVEKIVIFYKDGSCKIYKN